MPQLLERKAAEALATVRQIGEGYGQQGVALSEHALCHAYNLQHALDEFIARPAKHSGYSIAEVRAWRGEIDKTPE